MKAFRFYLDIDAENLEEAKEKLIDMAGDGGSFGDLENTELKLESWQKEDKISLEDLAKILKVDDPQKIDIFDIDSHFVDYDAWLCQHCDEDVGNDLRDMIRHLMKHTTEELKLTSDGDPIEEEEEEN